MKLTGIYVITHRQSLNLTKIMPVTKPLRFKDVSVLGESKFPLHDGHSYSESRKAEKMQRVRLY